MQVAAPLLKEAEAENAKQSETIRMFKHMGVMLRKRRIQSLRQPADLACRHARF